jgi:RNA polymerase sigma-70 factor (ECF subfamily)
MPNIPQDSPVSTEDLTDRGAQGISEPAIPQQRQTGPADIPSDATLLLRLASNDELALDLLLERYWAPTFRFALRRTGSPDVAADVVQDVFCRLWARRASWRAQGSVRALLFRLTRNSAVSQHRGQHAHLRAKQNYAALSADRSTSGRLPAERAELREALERAIAALPARRREVFLLRMMDDLSYEDIARVMGTSKQTVANQLSRALATLRPALAHLLD